MVAEKVVITGIVKNGVVIPQAADPLPEGAQVDIVLTPLDTDLHEEFREWEAASDEAWAMINVWEAEDSA
jgi:hypothetical protein